MADQVYKVRDPSGAIREIKGPAGATDDEIIAQAKILLSDKASQIPGAPASQPAPPDDKRFFGEQTIGLGEAGASLLSGAIAAPVGQLAGVARSLTGGKYGTREGVLQGQDTASDVSRAMTYQPRTGAGRDYAGKVGDVLSASKVAGLNPMVGMEAAALGSPLASAARQQAGRVGGAIAEAPDAIRRALPSRQPAMAGIGSAMTDQARQRIERAASLPVPLKLTKGQAERTFEQQQFERETAKAPKEGEPLRQRFAEQNERILKNFDSWLDQTGAESGGLRATGQKVVDAIVTKAKKAKGEIKAQYDKARASGEMQAPVDTGPLVSWLEANEAEAVAAPAIDAIKNKLLKIGAIQVDKAGSIIAAAPAARALPKTLSQEIRGLGGIKLSEMPDTIGEGRAGIDRKGVAVALFKKDAEGLDELATQLKAKGFDIDTEAVDGGVQQLRDMLKDELEGRVKHYPLGSENQLGAARVDSEAVNQIMRQYNQASSDNAAAFGFDASDPGYIQAERNLVAVRDANIKALQTAQKETPAIDMGLGSSQFKSKPVSINDLEAIRKAASNLGDDSSNGHYMSEVKKVIDQMTEGVGGKEYKKARDLRIAYRNEFEDQAAINRLISTKPGTRDRAVAYEDVFNHSILKGSLDDVQNVAKTLKSAGAEGEQAWKELQGQTIQHLKDEITKNVATDIKGNRVVSAARLDRLVSEMDKDGKLDFIFGKKGGQQIRDVNDLAKDVFTAPPGSVNTSNTASILIGLLDTAVSGVSGVPLPIGSAINYGVRKVKSKALEKRVGQALNYQDSANRAGLSPTP